MGKVHRIALHKAWPWVFLDRAAGPGHCQHRLTEIQPDGVSPTACQPPSDVTRPAADVEGLVTWTDRSELYQAVFPPPVQAKALQIVNEIVTGGDGRKQFVNPGSAMVASIKVWVAHLFGKA